MNAQAPRIPTPWPALVAASLAFAPLGGELAAQAPDPSPNSPPTQAPSERAVPAKPKPQQGRVEGTVTFSWAAGGNPASPMTAPIDPGGRFRGTVEPSPFPRPSFSTLTIAAYPLNTDPGSQEPAPRSTRPPIATSVPDTNGRFSMALAPGEYEIVAIAETRPGRMDRVPTRSAKIRVEPGKTTRCAFSF